MVAPKVPQRKTTYAYRCGATEGVMEASKQRTTKRGGKHSFLGLAKPLIALLVLGFVFTILPWSDKISWQGLAGGRVELEGEIIGDWKGSGIQFDIDQEEASEWAGGRVEALRNGAAWISGGTGTTELGGQAEWDPGMLTVFQSIDLGWVVVAMVLFFIGLLFGVTRWWRLLLLVGCRARWASALRLTYLGLFFNLVMPGLTGGDVAKAVLVVREHPEQRAQALVSVVVDRLVGLGTLALLALVVVLLSGDTFLDVRLPMLIFFTAGLGGALIYFNRGVRRRLRFDALIAKLPFGEKLRRLDEAAQHYFAHPVELASAMLLSLGNHAGSICAVWALGRSFGVTEGEVSLFEYFALVPIANIVSSIPIAPSGWGVGEAVYIYLFTLIGASASLGVAVSVSFRLCQLLLGLLGGLFLLTKGARVELSELETEVASIEHS